MLSAQSAVMSGGNGIGSTNCGDVAAAGNESEIYDRQIRLWGAEAQVRASDLLEISRVA